VTQLLKIHNHVRSQRVCTIVGNAIGAVIILYLYCQTGIFSGFFGFLLMAFFLSCCCLAFFYSILHKKSESSITLAEGFVVCTTESGEMKISTTQKMEFRTTNYIDKDDDSLRCRLEIMINASVVFTSNEFKQHEIKRFCSKSWAAGEKISFHTCGKVLR
jgi:hypothetical protein